MLCIVAIVAVHYTHSNTCYVLLLLLLYTTHIAHMLCIVAIVAVHYTHSNTCYVLLLLLLYTTHIAHMLCIVAIVDCTHVGSATASFKDLVTLHRRTESAIAFYGHDNR